MKALTISQPWADLIRLREKFIENRFWMTNYRGPIAIHAGLGRQYLNKQELLKYDTGAVVAIAEVVACLRLADLRGLSGEILDETIEGTRYTPSAILSHKYTEGPCLWVLDNIRPIKPIKAKGAQGLWNWEASSVEYVDLSGLAGESSVGSSPTSSPSR